MLFILVSLCYSEGTKVFAQICANYNCQIYQSRSDLLQGLKEITKTSYVTLFQDLELDRSDFPVSDYDQFNRGINSHSCQIYIEGYNQEDAVNLTLSGFNVNDRKRGNFLILDNLHISFISGKVNISSLSIGDDSTLDGEKLELTVTDLNLNSKHLNMIKFIDFIRLTINGKLSDATSMPSFNQRIEYGESNLIHMTLSDISSALFNNNKLITMYENKHNEFVLPNYNFTATFIFDLIENTSFTIEGDAPINMNYNNFLYINPSNEQCKITVEDTNMINCYFSINLGKLKWNTEKMAKTLHLDGTVEFIPMKMVNADLFEYLSSGSITGDLVVDCNTLNFKGNISATSVSIRTHEIFSQNFYPNSLSMINGKLIIYGEKTECNFITNEDQNVFQIKSKYQIMVNELIFENNPILRNNADTRDIIKNIMKEGLIVKEKISGSFRIEVPDIYNTQDNFLNSIFIKTEKPIIDLQSVSLVYRTYEYGLMKDYCIYEISNDFSSLNNSNYSAGHAIGFKQTKKAFEQVTRICFSDIKSDCPDNYLTMDSNSNPSEYFNGFSYWYYFFSTDPTKTIEIKISQANGFFLFFDGVSNAKYKFYTGSNGNANVAEMHFIGKKISIDFGGSNIKFDSSLKIYIKGLDSEIKNLDKITVPKDTFLYLEEIALKDLKNFSELIEKIPFKSINIEKELNIKTFEFINGGWNITETDTYSYTIMGIDMAKLNVNLNADEIKLSTQKLNRINFISPFSRNKPVAIDVWDNADYNPFSEYHVLNYVFSSAYVPITKFLNNVYLDCSDKTVKELKVKNEAVLQYAMLYVSEGSNITSIVFENIIEHRGKFSHESNLSVKFLYGVSGSWSNEALEISQNVPNGFKLYKRAKVFFKNMETLGTLNGIVSFNYFEELFDYVIPSIIADKDSVDPKEYEINLMDNLDISAKEFKLLLISENGDKIHICGYDLLEYELNLLKKRRFLVFESQKSFQEIDNIVKFSNNKLNLKFKDIEFTFEKELKNLVYSSKGDDYQSNGKGTRNTEESKYFINQYYLKIASFSNDYASSKLTSAQIAGISVGCVVFVAILILVSIVIFKFKNKKDSSSVDSN